MSNAELLQTSDLCRYYRRARYVVRAVDHVNLAIHRGELLAIVGASGSGKSTLLNLLAGLDTPTGGTIRFGGLSLTDISRRELSAFRAQRVGMVFQSFNLLPHMSARRNVEMALYFTGVGNRERRRQADDILTRLGLADRLDHTPGELSGGEQQRVAIARALVKEPEILYADEPTGNLDRENSEQIGQLLSEFNRDGLTVVVATHDLTLARKHGQRILRMQYGSLGDGSPSPEPENRP